jgi:hypothetical protein
MKRSWYVAASIVVAAVPAGAATPTVAAPAEGPVSFNDQVIPILTRATCNAGACHGSSVGKNGFHLSLLGYDPEQDHDSLLRQGAGRRINRYDPAASLLVRKATGTVPHAGGARFAGGSLEANTLLRWIAEGAHGPRTDEPAVVSIAVDPSSAVLRPNGEQALRVTARYANGVSRDVTAFSRFACNQDHLARVDSTGRATAIRPGEAVVRASFRGQVAVSRLAIPGTAALPPGDPWALPASPNPIDRAVNAKLKRLRVAPSGTCTDAEFLRRAYLDLTGTLPSPEATRAFLAECAAELSKEAAPAKKPGAATGTVLAPTVAAAPPSGARVRLLDELLAGQDFVDLWTYRLGDLLHNTRRSLGTKGNRQFHQWLRTQVASARPWDQIVRDLLTSRGSFWDVGPANYYGTASGPLELAEITSQQFLGVRIQCARCHDHPFDRWTQSDYYRFAAFFARVQVKKGGERGDSVVVLADSGEVQHPKSGATMPARSLDGTVEAKAADRRADLASWLTSEQNPWFAQSIANRVWKLMLGRGIIDPVDDVRASNPPANEEALQTITRFLVDRRYDLKALVRLIATSQTYQRSAVTTASNRYDDSQFSRHVVRRLTAEQLIDSIVAATGISERYTGMAPGTRAAQLPDTSVPSYLLDLFGRPARTNVCECEREDEPNLAQALHIMNGESINGKIAGNGGRLAALLQGGKSDGAIVEELFLAALARRPTSRELQGSLGSIKMAGNRKEALADLFWALLNSREFLFTH